jgi:hypothetical protein
LTNPAQVAFLARGKEAPNMLVWASLVLLLLALAGLDAFCGRRALWWCSLVFVGAAISLYHCDPLTLAVLAILAVLVSPFLLLGAALVLLRRALNRRRHLRRPPTDRADALWLVGLALDLERDQPSPARRAANLGGRSGPSADITAPGTDERLK